MTLPGWQLPEYSDRAAAPGTLEVLTLGFAAYFLSMLVCWRLYVVRAWPRVLHFAPMTNVRRYLPLLWLLTGIKFLTVLIQPVDIMESATSTVTAVRYLAMSGTTFLLMSASRELVQTKNKGIWCAALVTNFSMDMAYASKAVILIVYLLPFAMALFYHRPRVFVLMTPFGLVSLLLLFSWSFALKADLPDAAIFSLENISGGFSIAQNRLNVVTPLELAIYHKPEMREVISDFPAGNTIVPHGILSLIPEALYPSRKPTDIGGLVAYELGYQDDTRTSFVSVTVFGELSWLSESKFWFMCMCMCLALAHAILFRALISISGGDFTTELALFFLFTCVFQGLEGYVVGRLVPSLKVLACGLTLLALYRHVTSRSQRA